MAPDAVRMDVTFKNPMASYHPGELVHGSVSIDVSSEIKAKGIKLHIYGMARVHWDEKRAYTKGSATKTSHKNSDVYLNETVDLLRKGDGEKLTLGHHTYPFSFRLPSNLPASFEGHWGRVQYTARAVLERSWKTDIDFTKTFTVVSLLDLNAEPDAANPVEVSDEMMVGSLCCTSGPIFGKLRLTRKGFVRGEVIPVHVEINNCSSRKMASSRVVLTQHVTFRAANTVRKHTHVIKSIAHGEVKAYKEQRWQDKHMDIPALPPSRLGGGCKVIDIKYILTLIIAPSGPGKELHVPLEIIIGTVPLRNVEARFSNPSLGGATDRNQLYPVLPAAGENPLPGIET